MARLSSLPVKVAGLVGKNITMGAYVKTDCVGVRLRIEGASSPVALATGEWEFLSVTYKRRESATNMDLSILTTKNQTCSIEVSNVTGVIGTRALAH